MNISCHQQGLHFIDNTLHFQNNIPSDSSPHNNDAHQFISGFGISFSIYAYQFIRENQTAARAVTRVGCFMDFILRQNVFENVLIDQKHKETANT